LIFLKPGVPAFLSNLFIIFLIGVTGYFAFLLYLAFNKNAAKNLTDLYLKILKTLRPKHYHQEKEVRTKASLTHYYEGFRTFRENPKLLIKPLILHLISYLLGLSVYVLIFYALGIPSTPEFYVVIYFIATAVQDAIASFSVGSLDIVLSTIFIIYGLPLGVSGIAALLVRSAGFWFPLFIGLIAVQIMGTRNLLAQTPALKKHRGNKA
jgi:uncharacterized protein (TIRG00374 family)